MTIDNLIESVHTLLCGVGLKKESDDNFLSHPDIAAFRYIDTSPEMAVLKQMAIDRQMGVLNTYWRIQLSIFGEESKYARYCLVDAGTTEQWYKLFQSAVLPFIISKNLPRYIA